MAPKRPRDEADPHDAAVSAHKKHKKGFQVGPANLPDGTYKRKVQKIKKDLIHKAKLKKEYAKIKSQEQPVSLKSVYERVEESDTQKPGTAPEPTLDPHPDRQKLLEQPSPEPEPAPARGAPRKRRPRPQPFKHEEELARKRREEAEARRKAREEAEKERQRRLAERERFRRTMAKARGGPDGKRKLGRESTVLLDKVKRLVGST